MWTREQERKVMLGAIAVVQVGILVVWDVVPAVKRNGQIQYILVDVGHCLLTGGTKDDSKVGVST